MGTKGTYSRKVNDLEPGNGNLEKENHPFRQLPKQEKRTTLQKTGDKNDTLQPKFDEWKMSKNGTLKMMLYFFQKNTGTMNLMMISRRKAFPYLYGSISTQTKAWFCNPKHLPNTELWMKYVCRSVQASGLQVTWIKHDKALYIKKQFPDVSNLANTKDLLVVAALQTFSKYIVANSHLKHASIQTFLFTPAPNARCIWRLRWKGRLCIVPPCIGTQHANGGHRWHVGWHGLHLLCTKMAGWVGRISQNVEGICRKIRFSPNKKLKI